VLIRPRSSLSAGVLAWLASRLAHLAPPRTNVPTLAASCSSGSAHLWAIDICLLVPMELIINA
jgi:hypothetical protein